MIIEEQNKSQEERNKVSKIFVMLKDVKLPKHYKFEYDCVEIRYVTWHGFIDTKVAEIDLDEKDILKITFVDEEDFNMLRNCFINSKTKFKLKVNSNYYY